MASSNEIAKCKRKVRYANDPAAQAALKRINPARRGGRPARVYRCPVCAGYHLSSQPKR